MRIAVLADIHANLTALRAALDDIAARGGSDEIWCLGDIAGYGPEPAECLACLREYPLTAVAGNHDLGLLGQIDLGDFNPAARSAVLIQRELVGQDDRDYLAGLPLTVAGPDFTLAHGSPAAPVREYLHEARAAAASFPHFATPWCLVGHTHVPAIYELEGGICRARDFPADIEFPLAGRRLIINPGSAGQPRNGDPMASYCLYDTAGQSIIRRRVTYDIGLTQARMRALGLPPPLAARLSYGV